MKRRTGTKQLRYNALVECAMVGNQMDKLDRYREIVRRVIEDYAKGKLSRGQIETEAIVDPVHDHYEVMHVVGYR
ncbi:MAG TPA: element excision factor XisI family protein [Pirellulales bacterium]|nr:element excision factor XisI family protein [Pirellulales bacterium]